MVGKVAPQTTIAANESELKLRFGGGLNSRASSDEIDERECSDGVNFDLDLGNTQFRPRKPFDLLGTATNAGRINGFAQLIKADGTISTLIQAHDTVYEVTDWDTWTSKGTVSSAARLRGPRSHIWTLDDVVLISDISGTEPVMQWDGTTLADVYHLLGGDFKAKYIHVEDERAYFANVVTNGVSTPHVVLASARSDYETLSSQNRPTSELGDDDPWFLPMPDLRPINGMVGAFGVLVFSTVRGVMHQLLGSTPTDFEIKTMHYDSFADGTESIVFAGNDIVYGRPGRIESLIATDTYGDVETNDLSLKVADSISSYEGWRLAYSSRHQRVYCQPDTIAEMWVFHKPLADTGLSPWMKWNTSHAMDMNPTTMWSMLDVEDGLEYIFCGDADGNVYRLEGTGDDGDGGTADITTNRTSRLFSGPGHAQIYDLHGAVKFRPVAGETSALTLAVQWQGATVFDKSIDMTLASSEAGAVFGGAYYFGGETYFGRHFEGRLARERFGIAGQGNDLQIFVESSGTTEFQINEIYMGFKAAG